MTLTAQIINITFKRIVRILCRIDDSQLNRVPLEGPLILAANHINFLEVPIMYTHLLPRSMTGFVKSENWDHFFFRWLFELWEAVPLHRGEADMAAIRAAFSALQQGKIFAVAPEGTRTGDGRLQKGHPGITVLALKSGIPILPVAYWGGEKFWQNLPHFRRTEFNIATGRPFILESRGVKVTKEVRQQMVDEIMYQIARLMPEQYRGYYADLSSLTERFIHFLDSPKLM